MLAEAPGSEIYFELISKLMTAYLPVILLLCIFLPILYRASKQSQIIRKRSIEHMNRIEAKTDEMIVLLKMIRDK